MSTAPVLVKARSFTVEVTQGPLRGSKFQLSKPLVQIGRGTENDVVLERDGKASRLHAEIRQMNGQFFLANVSEKNTLLLNGQPVNKTPVAIEGEVRIQLGESEFIFRSEKRQVAMLPPKTNLQVAKPQAVRPQIAKQQAPVQPSSVHRPAPGYQPPPVQKKKINPLYIIVGIIALAAIGMSFKKDKADRHALPEDIKSSEEIAVEIENTNKAIEEMETQVEKRGENTEQYKIAQQHYIKGFRDFRQGQYGRALQSFQAALAFYPQHELARQYVTRSRNKLDQQIKVLMNQGINYVSKGNYRLCISAFTSVITMIRDEKDLLYIEATKKKLQCEENMKRKY